MTAGLSPAAGVEEGLLLGLRLEQQSELHDGNSYVTHVLTRSSRRVEVSMLMVPRRAGFLYLGSEHYQVIHEQGDDWKRGSTAEHLWTATTKAVIAARRKALIAKLARLPEITGSAELGSYNVIEEIRYVTPKALCVERFALFGGSLYFATRIAKLQSLGAPVPTSLAQYVGQPTLKRFRHDVFAGLGLSSQRLAAIDAQPVRDPVKLIDEEGPRLNGTVDVFKDAVPCLGRHRGKVVLRGAVAVDRHRASLTEYVNLGADAAMPLVTSNEFPLDYQLFEEASPRLVDVLISPSATLVVAIVANTIVVIDVADRKAVLRVPVPNVEAVVMAEWTAGAAVDRWRRKAFEVPRD